MLRHYYACVIPIGLWQKRCEAVPRFFHDAQLNRGTALHRFCQNPYLINYAVVDFTRVGFPETIDKLVLNFIPILQQKSWYLL